MIWFLCGYIWLYIHRPFEIWPVLATLRIERVYMLMLIAVWFLVPGKRLVRNPLNTAFLFWFVALLIAWLCSPYAELGVPVVENTFKIGVFYLIVVTTVRDERGLRLLLLAFLVSMAMYMSHSLWEYRCGRYVWSSMGLRRMVGIDLTSSSPNMFSAACLYGLPMLLAFWSPAATRRTKQLIFAYIGLTVTCMLLTGSRAGFLGLLFLTVTMIVLFVRRRVRTLTIMACAAVLAWAVLPQDRRERYLTIVDSDRGPANAAASAEGRLLGFLAGIRLWTERPATGYGPGSFSAASGLEMQAHNLYGQTLGDLGTLGFVALGLIVLAFYRNCVAMRNFGAYSGQLSDSFPCRVCRAAGVSVLVLLFVGLAGHNLYRHYWMWFGAFQAIAVHIAGAQVNDWVASRQPQLTSHEIDTFVAST